MYTPALTPCQTSTIPVDIHSFFETLYGKEPIVSQDKKNTVYAIPEKEVSIITDPYGGCHIDVKAISTDQFAYAQRAIETLSESFRTSRAFDSIWIDIALPVSALTLSSIVPSSFRIGEPGKGDLIYDYQQKKLRIWHWLNSSKECAIPPGATHNIGATALILDMVAKKMLLVVNTRRNDSWNLPGGSFDPLKDNAPCYTALREAQEEGGFELEKSANFEPRLMGQMQFPFNQFAPAINQIWAYFIDGISQKLLNPPADEIKLAEWVSFDEIIASKGILRGLKLSEEIQSSLVAAINGLGFEKIVDKGWMIVHTSKV
jgi:8-oxo-dGTP pyrophosphatase MutT (NUDIX family)